MTMATRPDTRTRILAAARAEFAARGFAGARVKTIAARARANKRMLYYYFRSKRRLFDAVLADAFRERAGGLSMTGDPVSVLVEWYRRVSQAPDLCRLLQWETLDTIARGRFARCSAVDGRSSENRRERHAGHNCVSKECRARVRVARTRGSDGVSCRVSSTRRTAYGGCTRDAVSSDRSMPGSFGHCCRTSTSRVGDDFVRSGCAAPLVVPWVESDR